MTSLIGIVKKQYKNFIPETQRRQVRDFVLDVLRKIDKRYSLLSFGLSPCRNYYALNAESVNFLSNLTEQNVSSTVIVEKQEANPAKHLKSQVHEDLNGFSLSMETVLLDIKDANFILSNNHLIDPSLKVLGGYRTQFSTLPVSKQLIKKTVHLDKTIAYLSDPEPTNYYHWMCGTLPLLRFYQNQNIDLFYIGEFSLCAFHTESLERAGLGIHQLLHHPSTAERIVAALSSRFINLNDPISKDAYKFTRALFSDVTSQSPSSGANKIYVSRGSASRRRVVNELEVESLLQNYGFTTVHMDSKSVSEQAQIFSDAQVVIAPHGAALTNLLFIQAGTKVIEIFPDGYINNCFHTLASYGSADYYYLLAEPIKQLSHDSHSLDIKVDIDKLDELCRMAFVNASS